MSGAKISALDMLESKPSSDDLLLPLKEYKTTPLLIQVPVEYFADETGHYELSLSVFNLVMLPYLRTKVRFSHVVKLL